jgi:tripartite-type tricarboxylate transporter receptor subunit TctC
MKLSHRRQFLRLAAGAAALPVVPRSARAQAYPSRPVRIIVGFAPGGTGDITARLMGQWLSEKLGQPFIVENRPGAATNIAAETVVKATADGNTLLWVTSANAIGASLYDKLSFNFIRDIAPIASISRVPLALIVNPSVPARSVGELVAYTKTNPGKLSMGSSGKGSANHVAGELLKMMAGLDMVHVPYRGGAPALNDLIGGQVQVMFDPIVGLIEHIKAGKVRALAVTTAIRADALPDIPTVGDFVPGYEATTWNGLGAPRNTPVEIVGKLNVAINAGLADPKLKARLTDLGGAPLAGSPADFGRLIVEETAKWAKVAKFAGIKAS